MPFSAIYDANVLYPFEVRDILMVAARTRVFALYWTDAILEECKRNLVKDGRVSEENMDRMINDMKRLYPKATIPLTSYESLIPVMQNNPKDRHVLAAAVSKKIDVIVTWNINDFPSDALDPHEIEAQIPDEFVRHVLDLAPSTFMYYFRKRVEERIKWAKANKKPIPTAESVASWLGKGKQPLSETSSFLLESLANFQYEDINETGL